MRIRATTLPKTFWGALQTSALEEGQLAIEATPALQVNFFHDAVARVLKSPKYGDCLAELKAFVSSEVCGTAALPDELAAAVQVLRTLTQGPEQWSAASSLVSACCTRCKS